MAFDASNPPLRSAPTSSSLVAPPLLTDRSAPGSNSSHSLSTTLVVTPVSTPPSKYSYPRYPGIASTSPPSAFANKRNSSSGLPIASIFESEEQRFDLLKTLDNPRADPKAELDWEVIDYADAPYPPEVKRSRSARLRINKMSMAEPPRPPPKKSGGSFLRRLTQSNHHGQDKRAPAPEAKRASPPQLPPLTGPDSRPISLNLNSIVPEVTAGNPQARPLPNGIDAPNGVRDAHARALSPTGPSPPAKQFGGVSSPSGYPSRPPPNSSLPPGAAAPEHSASPPGQQRSENRSSFKVQGRPDRTEGLPVPMNNRVPNGSAHLGGPPQLRSPPGPQPQSNLPNGHGGSYPQDHMQINPKLHAPITAALASPPLPSPDGMTYNNFPSMQQPQQQHYSRPPLLDGPSVPQKPTGRSPPQAAPRPPPHDAPRPPPHDAPRPPPHDAPRPPPHDAPRPPPHDAFYASRPPTGSPQGPPRPPPGAMRPPPPNPHNISPPAANRRGSYQGPVAMPQPYVPNGTPNVRPPPPQQQLGVRPAPPPPVANGYPVGAMQGLSVHDSPRTPNDPRQSAPSQQQQQQTRLISPPARTTSVRHAAGPRPPPPHHAANGMPSARPPAPHGAPVPQSPPFVPAPPVRSPVSSPPALSPHQYSASSPPASGAALQAVAAAPTPHQQSPTRPRIVIPQQPNGNVQPVPVPQPTVVQPTSTDVTPRQAPGPLPTQTTPRASPVPPAASVQQRDLKSPVDLNAVRSPTPPSSLGRLTPEPKQGTGYSGLGNGLPTSMGGSPLPPRVLSATNQARRIASSPLASPVFSNPSSPINGINGIAAAPARSASASAQARITPMSPNDSGGSAESAVAPASKPNSVRSSVLNRPRPRAKHLDRSLTALLVHPHITASLLPHININTFLNVLGSDETLRKYISGEMVGRWVMREWGVTVERERGRSWPGLTVWEGFLESLLHDPAVYSTYPQQYHNLLRHLSLSHTLIVLFLRTLPPSAFPYSPPLPFDDELQLPTLHKSSSMASMQGGRYPGSRTTSNAGSDAGHGGGGHSISRMPRGERVTEVVMPEPLSSTPKEVKTLHDSAPPSNFGPSKLRKRRGSAGSVTSIGSTGFFGRKRSASASSAQNVALASPAAALQPALPVPQGKAAFPPVSYPTAKRYEFRRYGDQPISPSPSAPNSRPGSIMSAQTSPSVVRGSTRNGRHQHGSIGQGMSDLGHGSDSLPVPPPIGGGRQNRSSLTSSEGRSSRGGANSPVHRRYESPTGSSRDLSSQMSHRAEPAFDRPPPFMPGRAPILRVFIPVSDRVPRWPSAEGAAASWRELEKCGADKRMKLGDLVVNTALHKPTNTEHVLVYVPFVAHKLVPLEYVHSPTGHLPRYLDAFAVSPVYYDPFLPAPQILYLDFAPYAQQAMNSLRLAYDRRDVTVASGARLSAKRYLHVAGLEIRPGDRVAADWQGMVTLEAEGTAEGKAEMEARFGRGDPTRAVMGPWEVVRERSLLGSLWLRLVREPRGN